MTAPPSDSSSKSLFTLPVEALREEREKLQTARNEITLFGGEFTVAFAGYFMYRFEVPEDLVLRGVDHIACSFSQLQPVNIDGRIVSLENQYITVALPMDFGAVLPEIRCQWNYDEHLSFVTDLLASTAPTHPVASLLLDPGRPENALPAGPEPVTVQGTLHEQTEALKKVLQNRVSYLWGPSRTGKTQTLALAALNCLKGGKNVLIVAPAARAADEVLQRIMMLNKELGVGLDGALSRVGLPTDPAIIDPPSLSLEYEVETQRTDKKKALEEGVSLLRAYWKTKVHQYLHEDFYTRLNELRERTNENRKQLDKVRDEITALKEIVTRAQNASMLEKFKKGFSKEDQAAAQKQLSEKLLVQKKLQPVQQALTAELMRLEAQAPIDGNELKDYQTAVKRIGELGGVKKLTDEVEGKSAVDIASLIATKRCIVTTPQNFFADHRLRTGRYDAVLVDDAARIQPPYLAALSAVARELILAAGDPFQLGPEALSRSDLAYTWLQQDIFLMLAQTERLDDLFEWAKKNPRWNLPLTSHLAGAPKVSRFQASFFFVDRIHVQDRPGAKGSLVVLDAADLKSTCKQYLGKRSLVPYNDAQTKRTVDIVKHALAKGHRVASEIGVIVPLQGTTLYTKLQLRLQGIRNVEVGTPALFQGRSKKTIIVDLTMAGVDYTMRPLDDRKIGEHKLARALNTILSCVEEELYVVADVGHFKSVYKDRLISKFLLQLQPQSEALPTLAASAKVYDELSWDKRERLFAAGLGKSGAGADRRAAELGVGQPRDVETELRMKMMARQQPGMVFTGRDFEQETFLAAHRILALRMDANLLSQMIGGDLLFRYSLGTEQAAARLPLDSCRNEEEFKKTMERWNLLLYEMSGAGKTDLTFFAKQTPEARIRWDINNLRAYYSSAMEAVMEESKHRIATTVTKVFQECLGKSQPANPIEWSTAYLNFLGKMEAYLAWISEQLRR
jgi:hypothetical protein